MYGISEKISNSCISGDICEPKTVISNCTTDFTFGGHSHWSKNHHGFGNDSLEGRGFDFSLETYYFANTPPAADVWVICMRNFTAKSVK